MITEQSNISSGSPPLFLVNFPSAEHFLILKEYIQKEVCFVPLTCRKAMKESSLIIRSIQENTQAREHFTHHRAEKKKTHTNNVSVNKFRIYSCILFYFQQYKAQTQAESIKLKLCDTV